MISTLFTHDLWPQIKPFAKLSIGRNNLDIFDLPDDLRTSAKEITCPCVACGNLIHVLRARMRSNRARISKVEERRLYYAATCPSNVNPGCSRSTAAKDHKKMVRDMLGKQREPIPMVSLKIVDASGMILFTVQVLTNALEDAKIVLPEHAAAIVIVSKNGEVK